MLSSRRAFTSTTIFFFFFNDTATTEIYTLSLHDALPISQHFAGQLHRARHEFTQHRELAGHLRSEEHTSELQSRQYLVCRLLLEKKKSNVAVQCQMPDVFRFIVPHQAPRCRAPGAQSAND